MKRLFALAISSFAGLYASAAFAATKAAEGHHDAGGSGLPQLDPSNFTSQIFWLLIAFGVMYVMFSRRILPEMSSVIESRHEHIQSDLDMAEELKKEAEEVHAAYEAILEDARKKSSKSFSQVEEKIKANTAEAYQKFQERSIKSIAEKEASIQKATSEAMEEMNGLAAEIAREAAEKIIGVETDLKQAKTVVKSINTSNAKAA